MSLLACYAYTGFFRMRLISSFILLRYHDLLTRTGSVDSVENRQAKGSDLNSRSLNVGLDNFMQRSGMENDYNPSKYTLVDNDSNSDERDVDPTLYQMHPPCFHTSSASSTPNNDSECVNYILT